MTVYSLGANDLPICSKHGIRVVTDFYVAEDGLTYERGKCPLCKKTYHFYIDDSEKLNDQVLTT